MTGHLLADDLMPPEGSVQSQHPTDSSRVLLGLMALSREAVAAEEDRAAADSLGGVISRGVLRRLLSALHFRDVSTMRHSRRVAMLAVGLAQSLGWEGRHLKLLEVAALLHDIGKIGVPDNILFKPGQLSPDEVQLMALHHNIGVDVLQACRVDKEVLDVVVQAHSHYSEASEGFQRAGSDVHQGARILAVADAYDSLSTDQAYREGKQHDDIIELLTDSAGTRFDGNIVCALSRWIESDGLPFAGNTAEPEGSSGPPSPDAAHSEEAVQAGALGHIFSYLYVLESLYDGFYLVDSDLRFIVWNRGAEKLLGHSAREMLGRVWTRRTLGYADKFDQPLPEDECPMNRVIAAGKPTSPTVRVQHAGGQWIEVELQTVPLLDAQGRLQGVAEIFRDLSRNSRRRQEYRELKLAASRDPLTRVANRGELETQLALMVSECSQRPDAEPFCVIFLDVDYFKSINDTHGHAVGDQVLVDLARLLRHETYSGEFIGRYGGEEFVILCPATELDQAVKRAERLRVALPKRCMGGLSDLPITASFGVTQGEPGDSVESVFRRADRALYQAKGSGRNKTCSLTNAELLAGGPASDSIDDGPSDPFVYTGTFQACIADDMIVYKLGGFVNDQGAKLREVSPRRAVIRLGRRGMLPFWGGTEARRPVELSLDFGDARAAAESRRRGASVQVDVQVRIRPLGWVRSREAFRSRAGRVMKLLRSYFAAG